MIAGLAIFCAVFFFALWHEERQRRKLAEWLAQHREREVKVWYRAYTDLLPLLRSRRRR